MTTIRVKPEELETVAKHVPDAEDACRRARTSLSWELPSLVMEIPGIGSAAIQELTDELLHWLRRYEEKLNEAEELLYRTAAAIRQADQTLADNMKEFGMELSGWYDLQRVFGEYDPVTGERISVGDRLFAGGMLLLTIIPLAKGAGVAGKAAIKGAKAAGIAAEVSKWISKTKNVLNVNKIKGAFQTIYYQVIKGPITATIRSFKQQWEQLLENVGSVLMGPQPALVGVGGPTSRMWMSGAERGTKETTMNIVGRTGASKGIGKADPDLIRKIDVDFLDRMEAAGGHTLDRHVSKTNEELIKRAIQEDVEAATTFTNKQIAIKAIQENLRKNADDIAKWLNESDTGRKIFDVSHNHPIGKGVLRDKKHVVYNLTNSRVVLIRDSTQELGFRILTAFPIVK